ncbi:MAG: thioredoxin family protein [Candidatus Methylacidiphilales bacterium]
MLKWKHLTAVALMAAFTLNQAAWAAPEIGKPAPEFTLVDSNGTSHNLSDFKGKVVVLEWLNHGCPFVVKHYESQNMQKLQKEYTEKGVVWLSIVSSAEGQQGFMTPEETNKAKEEKGAAPTAVLLDTDGKVGQLYDAKVTPEMFIINAEGILVYHGAIDSIRSTKVDDVAKAENYVKAALDEVLAGKPVTTAKTQAYGCSVKYKK